MFFVHQVFGGDKADYIGSRLGFLQENTIFSNNSKAYTGVIEKMSRTEVDLFFDLTNSTEIGNELGESLKGQILQRFNDACPLLEGEKVEEIKFWQPAGINYDLFDDRVIALQQTTNQAECFFMFNVKQLLNDQNVEPLPTDPLEQNCVTIGPVAQIASTIGLALLSTVTSKIAAYAIDQLFPPRLPSYFDQVYEEFRKILRNELDKKTIEDINAQINDGVVKWIRNVYVPRKDSNPKPSKKELYDALTPVVNKLLIELLPLLKKDPILGLEAFGIGANVTLALIQEQAMVDPNVTDPNLSSHVTTLRNYATDFINHAEMAAQKLSGVYLEEFKHEQWQIHLACRPLEDPRYWGWYFEVGQYYNVPGWYAIFFIPLTDRDIEQIQRYGWIWYSKQVENTQWGQEGLQRRDSEFIIGLHQGACGKSVDSWKKLLNHRLPTGA